MKSNGRKQTEKLFYNLYHRDYTQLSRICTYCGSPADNLDHVPPLSLVEDLNIDDFKKRGGEFLLVPSCSMCNNLLGNKTLPTKIDRANWLYNKYLALAEKHFHNWGDDELEELGPGLQKYIKAHDHIARDYVRRAQGAELSLLSLEAN